MKKKTNFSKAKKLLLEKRTIAFLSDSQMIILKGGQFEPTTSKIGDDGCVTKSTHPRCKTQEQQRLTQ